jgi:cbb3-type cytochrome oxidase subunit 1
VFTKNNARILTNPTSKELKAYKNSVIDPDLSQVRAVPPHFWKRGLGNLIVPMTDHEQKIRLSDIKENGVDNEVRRLPNFTFNPSVPFYILRQVGTVLFFSGSALFCYGILDKFYPQVIASLWGFLH